MTESSRSRQNRRPPTKRHFTATLLGMYLKNVREEKGLSQQEVGKLLNTNNSKVSRVELGEILVANSDLLAYSTLWQLDLAMLKALRDRKPESAKRTYAIIPHVLEALKEMKLRNKAAKGAKIVPPAKTREWRAEQKKVAKETSTQLTLPNVLDAIDAAITAADAPEPAMVEATPNHFFEFLRSKDVQLPCPTQKVGRDAWLLAMSGLYEVEVFVRPVG